MRQEQRKVIPIMRRRIDCASPIVFNCRQFSKPGTPWVLEEEPTATMILSYLNDVSKPKPSASYCRYRRDIEVGFVTI